MEQSPFGIILRAHDKDETKAFYEKLVMRFSEHQHGNGPLHYACEVRGSVLEIYQGRKQSEPKKEHDWHEIGETTLYVELPPELSIDQLITETKIIQVIREQAIVVLEDPDGRAVMVAQEKNNA